MRRRSTFGPSWRWLATLAALLVTLLLVGCGGAQRSRSGSAAGPAIGTGGTGGTSEHAATASGVLGGTAQPAAAPAAAQQTPLQQRDIVRTATLSVTVGEVDQAAARALARTKADGGRADGDDRNGALTSRRAELVLRVPPAKLDALIGYLAGLGHENSRTDHGQDVTASRADVDARVQALTISVGRLQDFLRHSGSITDLVALESQLTQRQAELQSTIAQQRALADQISLATLTVELLATAPPAGQAGTGPSGFGSAVLDALHALVLSLRWSAAILGYLLPFAVLVALLGWPVARYWRRRGTAVPPVASQPATD